jgi:peptidyl-prolyl cis-trans isomerase C
MKSTLLICILVATLPRISLSEEVVPAKAKTIVVNGEKIPEAMIEEYYARALLLLKADGKTVEPNAAAHEALLRQARAQAVQQTLLKQYVTKNNIVATPDAIKRELEKIRTDTEIAGFSLDQMLKDRGKTIEDFGQEISPSAALRQSCLSALDQAKLRKQFDRNIANVPRRRASHILFTHGGSKDKTRQNRLPAEAKRLAQEALTRVRNGEELSVIARECSDCPSAAQGGDLGWFAPDKMVKPFSDAVYAMAKVGDISPVVESEFGFHVIKMTALLSTDEECWQAYQREAAENLFQETLRRIIKEAVVAEE